MKNRKKLLAVSVLLVFVFTMIFAVACKKVDDGKNNGNVADRYDDESVYTDLSVRESTGTRHGLAGRTSCVPDSVPHPPGSDANARLRENAYHCRRNARQKRQSFWKSRL